MLIRFVVSNFLSFDEEMEFNMLSGPFKTHKHHVYKAGKLDVLKAAAIYGANGAGKSNLIIAIDLFSDFIRKGKIEHSLNKNKFKLNKENAQKPITFEIEFSVGKRIFAYGFSLNNLSIQEEWLYESGITSEDKLIFERKQTKLGKQTIKFSEAKVKTEKNKLLIQILEETLLKQNEFILGKFNILKMKEVSDARNWISHNLIVLFPSFKYNALTKSIYDNTNFREFVNDLLKTFDTGITSLEIESIELSKYLGEDDEELKDEIVARFEDQNEESIHIPIKDDIDIIVTKEKGRLIVKKTISKHISSEGVEISFDIDEESAGSKRLLDFIPAFNDLLNNEITFIVDEIDQSLHPVILHKLIQKIMDDESTKGQLIFSTHESNLLDLDIFRQDEIWFAEKDRKKGSTQLYSLSEFKPRYDLDIRKGYLKGRFGAIPFLAHLEDLNWPKHA